MFSKFNVARLLVVKVLVVIEMGYNIDTRHIGGRAPMIDCILLLYKDFSYFESFQYVYI